MINKCHKRNLWIKIPLNSNAAVQRLTAVTAYLKSKQLLLLSHSDTRFVDDDLILVLYTLNWDQRKLLLDLRCYTAKANDSNRLLCKVSSYRRIPLHCSILACKAKRQYLLTLQVSRYCRLASHASILQISLIIHVLCMTWLENYDCPLVLIKVWACPDKHDKQTKQFCHA